MRLLTPEHVKHLIGCQIVSNGNLQSTLFVKEIHLDDNAQKPVVVLINQDNEHVASKYFHATNVSSMAIYLEDNVDSLVSLSYFLRQVAPELPILEYDYE